MEQHHGFIADGYGRARAASGPIIRAQVQQEFAARLNSASDAGKQRIEREIEQEIDRRLKEVAPPDALY